MTTKAPLVLPRELQAVGDKLTRAVREVEVLEAWPEEKPAYLAAPQAEAIAQTLIAVLHDHLVNARLTYLFREVMERRGRVRLGVASKASSKIAYLAGFDFVLEFNWTYWGKLSPLQRIALVDHELSHCGRDVEHDKWVVLPHDVEEFSSIVERWGLWTPDLREFQQAMKAAQFDLFAPASEEPLAKT